MLRRALTMNKWKWTVVMFAAGGVYGFLKGYGVLQVIDLLKWKWAEIMLITNVIYEDVRVNGKKVFILFLFLVAGIVYGGLKTL